MPITSQGSGNGNNGAGATTLSIAQIPDPSSGMVAVVAITVRGTTTTVTNADWTAVRSQSDGTNTITRVFRRVYTAGDALVTGYSFTLGSSQKASGVLVAFSGVDTTTPIDSQGSQSNASSATITAPSITTATPNTMLLFIGGTATGTTAAAPTGWTLDDQAASTGGSAASRTTTGVSYLVDATAGATGTVSATYGAAATNSGLLIALREAVTVISGSYTASAIKRATITASATANAVIRATVSKTATASAVRRATIGVNTISEAMLRKTIAGSSTSNSVLRATQSGTTTAAAIKRATGAGTFSGAAIVRTLSSGSFSADSYQTVDGIPDWVSPADGTVISDTETLYFLLPYVPREMYFHLQLDTANTFNTANLRNYKSNIDQTGWEYWNGSAWVAMPATGVLPSHQGNQARFTPPTALGLGTWYRRIRAGS